MDYEEKYKDLVKRLNKAREEKGVYTFNSVLDVVAPELKIDESEDERIRKGLIEYFLHYPDHEITYYGLKADFVIAWLEKQGEKKPTEWSEEDERNLQGIIDEIEANKNHAPDYDVATYDRFLSWLKSLKERYTWKPSKEMLEALYRAVPENVMEISEDEMLLDKLYQGLKYGKVLSER